MPPNTSGVDTSEVDTSETSSPPQENIEDSQKEHSNYDSNSKKNPMPAAGPIPSGGFIGRRRKEKRNLIKDPNNSNRQSSLIKKIIKIADELDKRGITVLADKLDFILQEVGKIDAKKDSNI